MSVTFFCIKVKDTKERRHGEEKALKRHNIECMESIFPNTHEKCNEKSWNLENVTKLISCSILLDLKYMKEEKHDNRHLSGMYDSLEGNDIHKAMEDQIAELKTEKDSS